MRPKTYDLHRVTLILYFGFVGIVQGLIVPYNGTACTIDVCKFKDETLRFFQIGDWGGQEKPPFVTPAQLMVARTMDKMGEQRQVHFTISVGDNFYTSGPKYSNDSRFQTTFDDVYNYGRSNIIPWYITAGNHDYYGNISSQLEYALKNPRWVYPSLNYVAHFELGPKSTTLDFVFVDTVVLCGETFGGGIDPVTRKILPPYELPKGPKDRAQAEILWSWVRKQLSISRADYLFVVSHYPIFSAGHHGDFTCPGTRLLALLDEFNVTAYLFGHDHNLQYLRSVGPNGKIMHHILSGAGNSLDKRQRQLNITSEFNVSSLFFYPQKNEHRLPNTANVGGLVYAEIGHQNGSFMYFSGDGKLLYQVIVHPRNFQYSDSSPLMYYSNYTTNGYSIRSSFLLSAILLSIWLIGMALIRRSITRSIIRTKELHVSSRV